MSIIKGKVYVLKDDIDTDQIIPANFLNLVPTIPEEYDELGSHALAGLPDSYQPFMKPGENKAEYAILIAGRNFGCGSSREHAPVALGAAGVDAVIAESFARIFFRNCVATGEVYPLEVRDRLCDVFSTGDEAEINIEENTVVNKTTNKTYKTLPLGAAKDVVDAGGIFEYARRAGLCS